MELILSNIEISEQITTIGKFAYVVLIFSLIAKKINIIGYGFSFYLIIK